MNEWLRKSFGRIVRESGQFLVAKWLNCPILCQTDPFYKILSFILSSTLSCQTEVIWSFINHICLLSNMKKGNLLSIVRVSLVLSRMLKGIFGTKRYYCISYCIWLHEYNLWGTVSRYSLASQLGNYSSNFSKHALR